MIAKIAYTVFFVFILFNSLDAQANRNSPFSVEWIENYSMEKDFGKEENFFQKMVSYITGDVEKKLSNPFALIKFDANKYFVLDQGLKRPVLCSEDGINFIEGEIEYYPSLVDAAMFTNGRILFTDSQLKRVFVYNIENETIGEFKLENEVVQPTGISYSTHDKRIYITDTKVHRVKIFDVNGKFIGSLGKRGTKRGEFNYPTYVTSDSAGNVYVVDALNFRVQIFDSKGKFVSMFGQAGDASGYINRPKGIALDTFGHIYLVDALFHVVQVFNKEGQFLYNFGGQGRNNGKLWLPAGICIDRENNIFISDVYNSRIQKYRLIYEKD